MIDTDDLDILSKFKIFSHVGMDDFADKVSFQYSCLVLLVSSVVVTFKQYIMQPITCYMATDIGGVNIINFMEHYCWTQGTIPITYKGPFPNNEQEWKKLEKEKILYYQWAPFVLALQCICCYLPQMFWKLFIMNRGGTNLKHFMATASQTVTMNGDERIENIKRMATSLEAIIFQTEEEPVKNRPLWLQRIYNIYSTLTKIKRLGTHIVWFYLFIKLLYIINSIGQLIFMQRFLNLNSTDYRFFGAKILYDVRNGKDWQNSLVFARVAYCCAQIRILGATNYAVAQCVLPVNMLNEKIYIFFWFWMVTVSVVALTSFVIWVFRILSLNSKSEFVSKYLKLNQLYSKCARRRIVKFENHLLRDDGIFILRMLSENFGDVITAEVVGQLWDIYKRKYDKLDNLLLDKQGADSDIPQKSKLNFQRLNSICYATAPPLLSKVKSASFIENEDHV